ncbi:mannitol-1-phosphate 5-dehydrogenase [Saccharococcus caldoxylosilyticus]|uniref:Mannitol-1-phosphate 5-dehydrogenase n=1 Tax=Parageobacillus caldoxylosilyticus NBRC 107762 TaxID=1220594 RepID=A0A023DI43_9BACL|nr:mannitol-1-phosphate 5-dehydrogenase [Parageobacillus caldoxylosilyticus]OQP00135.1 mannitol-1-phosphate 5-dehydrogenase [Geobacillus sp. 44B]MBB3853405.1 mannitol-1-phosphate 5-dehydrogenase [Parageobacillus caldoxylosilyticus]QNU36938.1 mannitol-1-phosphate 5-dehydrogenase [Geobacillus sp. 44B]BDG36199.1 mannitol-1-phosphate 5-dehydrogenase [Parageobacillus caldoxylosilyticus]BDG39984.1 mannitol-1-phosphate 5-dehydrogenase [Parageobacillus caldoxylosilyticus]
MLAVHFGAGNIGRGFIGSLLSQSGYEVMFVDINDEVVRLLKEKQEYRVIIADENRQEQLIRNVSAVNSQTEREKLIDYITKAHLITTAVGPHILPAIATILAEGLQKRITINKTPLHIIACENMIGGSDVLKSHVFAKISETDKPLFETYYGFLNCAVDRIVPNQKNDDPLSVVVEPFFEWVIEKQNIIGDIPPIQGAHFVDDLKPYIERKLFTVNTGHAIASYLGYYKKWKTIQEAMNDGEIRSDVEKALHESGAVLVKKYGWNENEHQSYIQKIIQRFLNPSISDEVVRVARSPIRKLGANDRLVGPATQYYDLFGQVPLGLVKGIAALLLFDYENDDEAVALQKTIQETGVEGALYQYSQLEKDHPLVIAIKDQWQHLK